MYTPSPSIPSQSVIQKPSRPPPPILLSSRKAPSNRGEEAKPPSSNRWADPGAGPAVVGSGFQPHCRMIAGEEQPLAEPGVDGVQVGGVGCVRPHVEARIAAQDVEAARAQDQARARERRCGRSHAAERRARLGYVPVYLEAEVVT